MHVCPACHTPRTAHDTICASCGLIFASHPSGAWPQAQQGVTAPLPQGAAVPPAPSAPVPLVEGQRLARGRYTVQRLISRGGMGAIALASDHEAFGRPVVVKAMLDYFDPSSPQDAREARELFLQEARTLASLRHPSIPQIFAYFQDGPHNYIVMEYVEGFDLEQGLTRRDERGALVASGRPYPLDQVLRWGVTVCRILEYLGARQPPVVHHDIKPANLLLDHNSGEVRLVDFGTARPRPTGGGALASGFGTPGYAPPEQYRGESELRSDVYALAATLYHLATDDDPRDHPFAFPQLGGLGALGQVLEGALSLEAIRRSSASDLRAELEKLLSPAGLPQIEAPDGTALADLAALAAWCEPNWALATAWLYGALPNLLELRWGQTRLARELRECVRQHRGDENAGLDAALALLDPQGFGQAPPRLRVNPPRIDFGTFSSEAPQRAALTLTNAGRRHLTITLVRPGWVGTVRPLVSLAPGQHQTLDLTAHLLRGVNFASRHALGLTHAGRSLGEVEVTARLALGLRVRRALRVRPSMLAALCVVVAVLMGRTVLDSGKRSSSTQPSYLQPTPALRMGYPPPSSAPRPASQAAYPAFSSSTPTPFAKASPDHPVVLPANDSAVALSPDGTLLATAYDHVVQLWRLPGLSPVRNMGQHTGGPVTKLAWRPDGKALASVSDDGEIKVWNFDDGMPLAIFKRRLAGGIAWRPDGKAIALVTADHRVEIVDVPSGNTLQAFAVEAFAPYWSPDGGLLYITAQHGVMVVDTLNASVRHMLVMRVETREQLAFSAQARTFALYDNNVIQIRGLPDGKLLHTIDYLDHDVPEMTISGDGRLLVTRTPQEGVKLWELSTGKSVDLEKVTTSSNVIFSPDNRKLIELQFSGALEVLDVPKIP
jgi:serine/threonine protein kinase